MGGVAAVLFIGFWLGCILLFSRPMDGSNTGLENIIEHYKKKKIKRKFSTMTLDEYRIYISLKYKSPIKAVKYLKKINML